MDLNMKWMLPVLGVRRESSFGSIIAFIKGEDETDTSFKHLTAINMSVISIPNTSLEFVNISANGTSEGEKKRNKRVVRSAAMKSFRREQKSQKTHKDDKTGSRTNTSTPRIDKTFQQNQSKFSPVATDESHGTSTLFDDNLSEHSWLTGETALLTESQFGLSSTFSDSWSDMTPSSSFHQNPPVFDYLGAGRGDPFDTTICDAGPQAGSLMDHSFSTVWPGFRLCRPNDPKGLQLAAELHQMVRESPIIMHSFLYGAIVHLDILHFPNINLDNPIRLYHKVQVLKLLRAELDLPASAQAPLENLILAVLSLTSSEIETMVLNTRNKITSPFNPPLPSLQWLDVYGSIIHIPEHTIALIDLVVRKGGIEKIELEGLAELLSLSDIIHASQFQTKPSWPVLQRTLDHVASKPIFEATHVQRFQLGHLAQGFAPLYSMTLISELRQVLRLMAGLTVTIDGYFRGSSPVFDIEHLVDRRNVTQYRLLSLPHSSELDSGEVQVPWLYEGIRLSAMIYSIAVTFPLPPLGGIFHTLSTSLQCTLKNVGPSICSLNIPKALLWMLVMGGIASSGTPHRTWYVTNLRSVAKKLELNRWDCVVAQLRYFLWLDCSCEEGGRQLWDEVTGRDRY